MKIALAQLNPKVGDLAGNFDLILAAIADARAQGADIIVTPELALSGYPPEDLLLRPSFLKQCQRLIGRIIDEVDDITVVIGHPHAAGGERFNAASVIRDGKVLGRYEKMLLPNDEVFDEVRYFTPGYAPLVFEQQTPDGVVNVGVVICEDIWDIEPASAARDEGAELLLVLNASPYHKAKQQMRRDQVVANRVDETGIPIAYVNMVGGQDELVFDGHSFALNKAADLVAQAPAFVPATLLVDYRDGDLQFGDVAADLDEVASVYQALVLGVKDYIGKNGFPGVLLGLSGGIDSALTLAIAVDALGADKVHAVMMPSRYTADISVTDSREMIELLGCQYSEIEIWPMYEAFMAGLAPHFAGLPMDASEENLQSRIRGTLLMALSNKSGRLVLTTGNKSEMTTGYATLYGDMAGGFAVLKDVAKTLVYKLSNWRNTQGRVIPERIITRPPSAELRPDQKDQDSLPEYDILDAILALYVEENLSRDEIKARGYAGDDVDKVVRLLRINEYKRRQAPVGPRVTSRAFGKDWRMPITNGYRD
ncbi:NAD+ synthase (glutamine-hydrolysing) [Andreprevotia lacus DSM 23236]|uniref:Glutamine-dependent NAD(+) synthetase n=1 Tax=Andreprevotia lacus DSM 23236 TaxID=1121001 RepID=A0A1W1WXK6_9NEIS|nr:NAD+ synthase [Andreprevotia lacus]SMC16158.1 NAD+ synthase (glutamine-hydrolysing) [Andreprevotia lacus DSM 23236]